MACQSFVSYIANIIDNDYVSCTGVTNILKLHDHKLSDMDDRTLTLGIISIDSFKWIIHQQEYRLFSIYFSGNYGQRGIESFTKLADEAGVCIAKAAKIARGATDDEHIEIIKKLMMKRRARVIICFCDGETVRSLYNATTMVPGAKNHFLVVGR